ncbi:phosphoribosylformimino-5-aminoimidazole carboxamide ribotide isomerase [Akkermansiaceae bacterium]|nr:phosphoribosylformimino-5-aminoimidazole carboxamide ribotide isomerase [Akkermansiaceae bacterium]
MTKFRPCIDIHNGKVKQIVGGTLSDSGEGVKENFVSDKDSAEFAQMYADDQLTGGHVIQLGAGNVEAAQRALAAYPKGLQIGGGITLKNASSWLDQGASHIILTSWLFSKQGEFILENLQKLCAEVGKEKIVVDLSCRRVAGESAEDISWVVAMNRWQTLTNLAITPENLETISQYCDELLIHAADVEGLCQGIDKELVEYLSKSANIPMTYAGGVRCLEDLTLIDTLSKGKIDVTVGSALDVFGGSQIKYQDLVEWNLREGE